MLNPAQPYFYLLAFILIQYVRPHEFVPAFVGIPIVPVLLVIATGFWLIAQKKDFEAPQHRLILGLVLAIFASVAITGWVGGATTVLVEFAPTMILFYLVATSVDSVTRFKQMSIVLTGVACVMALHGVDQTASEGGVGWTGSVMSQERITYLGFLNDPNDLAMVFVMTLPLTMYLAHSSASFLERHAYHAAAALILYGVYLCNSRGSLLALAAVLIAFAMRRFGSVRGAIVGPILLVPLVLLAPSRGGDMSAGEESAAGRVDAWYEGFQMLRSQPLLGVGKGMFTEHHELTAHNSFVLALAEIGLVGYFFWMSMLFLSGMMLYRILRAGGPPLPPADLAAPRCDRPTNAWGDWESIARTLMYVGIGTVVSAFFLSRTYIPVIYLVIGLIVAAYQGVRRQWPAFAPIELRENLKLLLIVEFASVFALWLLTRMLQQTA